MNKKYKVKLANKEDLKKIVKLGQSLVGDSHINLKTLEGRYNINPKIVTGLYKEDEDSLSFKLVGYYILYPLTSDAYIAIHQARIVNGRGIQNKDICLSFSDATTVYIGMIGAVSKYASGFLVREMLTQISVLNSDKLKAICSRGATNAGIKFLKGLGFQKISRPSEISCLFLSKENLSNNRFNRYLSCRGFDDGKPPVDDLPSLTKPTILRES